MIQHSAEAILDLFTPVNVSIVTANKTYFHPVVKTTAFSAFARSWWSCCQNVSV